MVTGETALRAETEVVDVGECRCFLDAFLQLVPGFEFRRFGRDQAEHSSFVFGKIFERREVTGEWRVVLEEIAVGIHFVEQRICDKVVAAFCLPVTLIVTAA